MTHLKKKQHTRVLIWAEGWTRTAWRLSRLDGPASLLRYGTFMQNLMDIIVIPLPSSTPPPQFVMLPSPSCDIVLTSTNLPQMINMIILANDIIVMCIFDIWTVSAQYSYQFIKTPIFVLNSIYDTAQLRGLYQLPCLPPNCTDDQVQQLMNFGSVSEHIMRVSS